MSIFEKGKKCIGWFAAGFCDRMASRLSGKRITIGKQLAAKLNECEPWSNHIEPSIIPGINECVKNRDFQQARLLTDIGIKPDADPMCVQFLLGAIELLASGVEFQIETIAFLE